MSGCENSDGSSMYRFCGRLFASIQQGKLLRRSVKFSWCDTRGVKQSVTVISAAESCELVAALSFQQQGEQHDVERWLEMFPFSGFSISDMTSLFWYVVIYYINRQRSPVISARRAAVWSLTWKLWLGHQSDGITMGRQRGRRLWEEGVKGGPDCIFVLF